MQQLGSDDVLDRIEEQLEELIEQVRQLIDAQK